MEQMEGSAGAFRPSDGLAYLFLDFNAYFASVEQHDHPELMGRPVIVTPLASEHTGAIAASYEAKAFGIKRGTKVRDARELCPDIAVMPARAFGAPQTICFSPSTVSTVQTRSLSASGCGRTPTTRPVRTPSRPSPMGSAPSISAAG